MSRCCRSRLEQSHCEPRSGVAIQNSFNFQNLQFMKVIEILFVSLRNWITSLSLVMTVFSHSVLRYGICQCWLFYIWKHTILHPAPNILSFLLRWKKKEHWIRKKNNADQKQSLNSTLNSWTRYRSDNTSFFIVSLSDCRLIVMFVS